MARKKVTETQEKLSEVQSALDRVKFELESVKMDDGEKRHMLEQMNSFSMAMDDRGWTPLLGGTFGDDGPTLDAVKEDHKKISQLLAKQSWIKRGHTLRYSYIWKDGIKYAQITDGAVNTADKRTKGAKVQSYIDLPINQKNFFGTSARMQREAALYSSGIALYMADDRDHTLRPLPVMQITADYRNPEDPTEIWAYRRQWSSYHPNRATPDIELRWYFHDVYWDKNTMASIDTGNGPEPVDKKVRLFGAPVNTQQGWGYGVADASAAVPWLKLYRDFLINGYTVTEAMAQIWAVAKQNSKSGADSASLALGKGGSGQTAIMGTTDSLTPLSSAGQAYAFEKGIQLAAAAASAIEISAIALLSDTSAAGGSYGSAQTLDLPTRLAMESRRAFHVDLDTAVLKWMGSKDPQVYFTPYTEATDQYRLVQAAVLAWSTGVYTADQMLEIIDDIFGIHTDDKMPGGVLVPNTKASIAANTPAPAATDDTTDAKDTTTGKGAQAGGAGQGQGNGTKNDTGGNDARSDTLTK